MTSWKVFIHSFTGMGKGAKISKFNASLICKYFYYATPNLKRKEFYCFFAKHMHKNNFIKHKCNNSLTRLKAH